MRSNYTATGNSRIAEYKSTQQDAACIGRYRVALICDYLEEKWPSMDLVADMLYRQFDETSPEWEVMQFRPPFHARFSRVPLLPHQLSWNADRLANRFLDYPSLIRRQRSRIDLFHLIDHSYSHLVHELPQERTVVTCHDLDTFRCILNPTADSRPRWFRAMSERILAGFRKARHIIAVSAATRDKLLEYDIVPPERVTVVHNGVHQAYTPEPNPAADRIAAELLPENDNNILLLNVGSVQPRKRIDVLLRVFAAVRRQLPESRLVRVGGPFTPSQLRLAASLDIDRHISVLPFLKPEILAAVYRRAPLLLHTAEAEGFGLPIVEGMACGCAVIASDLPVLREVGGPAAEFCPVADIDSWKEKVVDLIGEAQCGGAGWSLRRERALAHAARFSWAENTRQTAQIYEAVLRDSTNVRKH